MHRLVIMSWFCIYLLRNILFVYWVRLHVSFSRSFAFCPLLTQGMHLASGVCSSYMSVKESGAEDSVACSWSSNLSEFSSSRVAEAEGNFRCISPLHCPAQTIKSIWCEFLPFNCDFLPPNSPNPKTQPAQTAVPERKRTQGWKRWQRNTEILLVTYVMD